MSITKKEYKRIVRDKKIIEVLFIINWCVLMFSFYNSYSFMFPPNYKTSFYYEGLNESQISIIQGIMKEVNPIYLEKTHSIRFVNQTFPGTCNILDRLLGDDTQFLGCNSNHRIIVEYQDDIELLKNIVCHELSHNFLKSEEITENLGDQEVCFN